MTHSIKTYRNILLIGLFVLMGLLSSFQSAAANGESLILTGVIDGPLTGGVPKGVELYAPTAIADLSQYGVGSANNGGGSDGEEFTFPAIPVAAGTCIYVATEETAFESFFGFKPDFTTGAMAINGDDAVEVFYDGSVIDILGDINVDGTGEPWEYLDGWAYRNQATGPDGNSFVLGNGSFSGKNALDGETSNATAATPFPVAAYPSSGDCKRIEYTPEVSSSSPFDGQSGIAGDANITVNFSEDVTVSGTWYDLTCTVSGSHTAVVTGGPASYMLDPDTDFDLGESCTLTVYAAQVADVDTNDPPDNMAADYTATFETGINWVINEFLADPASGSAGDANGDGTRDGSKDEFVEIINVSGSEVDISGWTISDAGSTRHTFPSGTRVPDQCAVLVFGGGTPTGVFGGSVVQTASGGYLGLNNGGDTVSLADGSSIVATYAYGSEGNDNQSLTLDPDVTGTAFVKHALATGSGGALFSPGTTIDGSQFSGCPKILKIHEVQGSGSSTPYSGQDVIIEGIVVGDFQDDLGINGDLDGFFVQEEDADADGDASTSEGIFVYQGSNPAFDIAIGDLVRVVGEVEEFRGMTDITSFSGVTVLSTGNPLPTITDVTLPVADVSDFEAYEGMYVRFPQTLTISEYFNFDRFGEIVLTTDRQFQPTAIYEPGSGDAADLADLNARSRITLDDGRTSQNPDPAIHPNGLEFDLTNLFRGGDLVTDATGVLNEAFGLYRIQPTQGANYTANNLRTAAPDPVGGNLTVSGFNVLNYFNTLDQGPDSCGPDQDLGCRGADNENERIRQLAKIVAAMNIIDADVYGVVEVENTTGVEAMADIVNDLNDLQGAGTYAYIDTGTVGTDAIKVGLIYKPDSVTPYGAYEVLDTPEFVSPTDIGPKNRAALAQTFVHNDTGGVFTVVVNHLKSKGSGCGAGDDDPEQGSCNLTRTLAAQELLNWLAGDPTSSNDGDFMILGDLNAYDKEDPIDTLTNGGYTDLEAFYGGEYAYSYVFNGQLGYLDYAMSSADLTPEVTGTTAWHINADEADLIDYDTSFKKSAQDAIYAPDAYRASDHDPVIVGLGMSTEAEIYELIEDVEGLLADDVLNDGQANSLNSKLENILEKLAKGQTKAAANQLSAFINQVEAFVNAEILTSEQGDPLIAAASLLIEALSQ